MARSPSPTSESQDVRDVILHESGRLFVDRGYHGLSMREVVEAVGVSKAALYYHYRDKEDLFMAVLVSNLDRIELVINEARQPLTTRQRIEQMVQSIFQHAPEQRAIIRLASQEMAHSQNRVPTRSRESEVNIALLKNGARRDGRECQGPPCHS